MIKDARLDKPLTAFFILTKECGSSGVRRRTSDDQMLKRFRHKSGQSITAEVVITFVLVTVVIVAMSTYVRRTMQARVRDATIFTRDEASSALGGANVDLQYEPYYVLAESQTNQVSTDLSRISTVNGEFMRDSLQGRVVVANSVQLAPKDRD